jgi:Tfp pilus assembly protein PilV
MIELLVTLMITVIGLTGALALHKSLSAGSASATQSLEASVVGAGVMEQLRAKRTLELATAITGSPSSAPPFARTAYTSVIGRNGMTYTVDVDVDAMSGTLWRIRVETRWTDDATGESRSLPIELLRASTEAM